MKKISMMLVGAALAFSANTVQAAEEWGLEGEKIARFPAKVVDIACELTGDCPKNCGDGKRQLGLIDEQGKLHLVIKNKDIFAGAVNDLLPFCGQRITVDGLLIANKHMPMFQIQFKRPAPEGKEPGKWSGATWFTRDWAKKHGKDGEQWFRHDPRVAAEVSKNSALGNPKFKLPKE